MLKERARLLTSGLSLVEAAAWGGAFFVARALAQADAPLAFGLAAALGWEGYARASGLRLSQRTRPMGDEGQSTILGAGVAGIALVLAEFLFAPGLDLRAVTAGAILLGGAAVLALRLSIRAGLRAARARGYNTRRVAIAGAGARAARVAAAAEEHREWGLVTVGFIGSDAPEPRLGDLGDLDRILTGHALDAVLFAAGPADLAGYAGALALCAEAGVETRVVFGDLLPATPGIDDLDGMPTLVFRTTPHAERDLWIKRAFDLIASVSALALGAPLLLALAAAIRLQDGGPALFVQERIGQSGRVFRMYKFRTMTVDAEARKAALRSETDGPVFKVREDPRITRLGRWLRKTSLDELPQFYNVLRGEMSVVGPRPPLPEEAARYARWQRRRLSVRPGITGMWQVSGRSDVRFEEWMRLDLAYIDGWSLGLDAWILWRTLPAVWSGKGAY